MGDVKEFVKKYWPYLLGGVVGLYLIMRFSGGGGSSSGSSDYAAFMQAQTAAAGQNAALQLQAQTAADANALQNKQLDAQITLQNKSIDSQVAMNAATLQVQNNANYAAAFNGFQSAQAAMAQSIGGSTAQIIDALNAPAITAMQAGAYENAATTAAAGNVAAASFMAQGGVVSAAVGASKAVGQMMSGALGATANTVANLGSQQGKYTGLINAGANAYSAYASGGMSGMFSQGSGDQLPGNVSGNTTGYADTGYDLGAFSGLLGGPAQPAQFNSSLGGGNLSSVKYAGSAWGGV